MNEQEYSIGRSVPTEPEEPAVAEERTSPDSTDTPPPRTPTVGTILMTSVISALIVGLLSGLAAGFGGAWLVTRDRLPNPDSGSIRVVSGETEEPVAAAAAAALQSVVNIEVVGDAKKQNEKLPEGHPRAPARGNGSGVAFRHTNDGATLLLTNAHVVEDAEKIIVTGADRERHSGTLVGVDAETDIAVVRIETKLPLVEIGKSSDLAVGQLVVAIGSPFGLTHSVSSGVVSAVGRSITQSLTAKRGVYPLVDVIQTDAAINPGNSGGALVDRKGRLVGINTAIFTESGANDGVGFAIPIDNALRIVEQLLESGSAEHPFLGIIGRDIDDELVASEKLPVDEGAFVVEVTKGTEAAKSGIRPNDVIVGLNEETIRSMNDLILQVRRHQVGDTVTVTLYRGNKRLQIKMKVGVKPANLELPSEIPTSPGKP